MISFLIKTYKYYAKKLMHFYIIYIIFKALS